MKRPQFYTFICLFVAISGCDSSMERNATHAEPETRSVIDGASAEANPMFEALKFEDLERLDALYESGHVIDSLDPDGRTLLHNAVELQSQASVEWLLNRGANPKGDPSTQQSPLPLAVELAQKSHVNAGDSSNSYAILKLLIEHGADPMEHHNGYASAVQRAMDIGCEPCISFMKEVALTQAADLAMPTSIN